MKKELLEAKEASTSPERLVELSTHASVQVRRAVAQNPNTPNETLLALAVHHPDDVLSNPVLGLLTLENPAFFTESFDAAEAFLSSRKCPPALFEQAAERGIGLGNIVANPNTPKAVLEYLAKSNIASVAEAAKSHIALAGDFAGNVELAAAAKLMQEKIDLNEKECGWLLSADAIPVWLLEKLSSSRMPEMRKLVAEHSDTPAHVLKYLLSDGEEDVRKQAAAHAQAPQAILEIFARAEALDASLEPETLAQLSALGGWGRQLAARHPNTPPDILTGLGNYENWQIRRALARNPSTPESVLNKIPKDLDLDVQRALACNSGATQVTLEQLLLSGGSRELVELVAEHPNAPRALVEQLRRAISGDPALTERELNALIAKGGWAKWAAARHPNLSESALWALVNEDWDVRLEIVRNPKCPEAVLRTVSQMFDERLRCGVASNPATPKDVLKCLGSDREIEVRKLVAKNPATTPEILEWLSDDPSWSVRQLVAAHANTSAATLLMLARDGWDTRKVVASREYLPASVIAGMLRIPQPENPETLERVYHQIRSGQPDAPRDWIEHFARSDGWARGMAARHPCCPVSILRQLHQDADSTVREAVAGNPNATAEILKWLANDVDANVRLAVASNPNSSAYALARLYLDVRSEVRLAVSSHKNTPPHALEYLCGDERKEIRAEARKHPCVSAQVLELHRQLETNASELTSESLECLALAGNWSRKLVAQHPSTPPVVLAQLARSKEWPVRLAVAGNLSTPPNTLKILIEDHLFDVKLAAAKNPNMPPKVLELLLQNRFDALERVAIENPSLDPKVRERRRRAAIRLFIGPGGGLARVAGLAHPDISGREPGKRHNLRSPRWFERFALAMNPRLSQTELKWLAGDGHRLVRAAARRQLKMRKKEGRKESSHE